MPEPAVTLAEVCVESSDGALVAARAGADRVELCAGLVEGGTTPSLGEIERAVGESSVPVFVLVRPRGGDFVYSTGEFAVLRRDVEAVRRAGAAGVVIGALDADGEVDVERTRVLADVARPLAVTFHRAFDHSRDAERSLDRLIAIGVDRVLTSGRAATALEGAATIRALIERATGALVVLAGGGIREHNVRAVVATTGASEVHFRAASRVASTARFRNAACRLGTSAVPDDGELDRTAPELVRRMLVALGREVR